MRNRSATNRSAPVTHYALRHDRSPAIPMLEYGMPTPLSRKVTIGDLRAARRSGEKVPMLTCYDYSTARLMQEAGVSMLLVGDSAANVILGYSTTLPVSLSFMIEITAAVRRGAPNCMLIADMPFG